MSLADRSGDLSTTDLWSEDGLAMSEFAYGRSEEPLREIFKQNVTQLYV